MNVNKSILKIVFPVVAGAVSLSSSLIVASADEQLVLPGLEDGSWDSGSEVHTGWVSWAHLVTTSDLTEILSAIEEMLPILLPIVVGFVGIRKALSFLLGSLRKA